MARAGADRNHAGQVRHCDGQRVGILVAPAVPQLSESVVAPRPYGAVCFKGVARESPRPGGDRNSAAQAAHPDGRKDVGAAVAVSDLPVVVEPPRPHASVGLQGERVEVTGSDRPHAVEAGHLNGRRGGAIAALTELAPAAVSPGPDGAIRLQRQAEVAAADDGGNTGQVAHLAGSGETAIRGDRPVSELAVSVVAPCPGVAGGSGGSCDGCQRQRARTKHQCQTENVPNHRCLQFRNGVRSPTTSYARSTASVSAFESGENAWFTSAVWRGWDCPHGQWRPSPSCN